LSGQSEGSSPVPGAPFLREFGQGCDALHHASPGRTVVIDCETTDLPGALAVVVSLPRGLAKPGHSLARPRRQAGNWNRSGPPTPRKRCQKLQGMPWAVSRPSCQALLPGEWRTHRSRTSGAWLRGTSGHSGNTARAILRHSKRQVVEAIDRRRPTSRGVVGSPAGSLSGIRLLGLPGCHRPGTATQEGAHPMTTATAAHTRPRARVMAHR